MERSKRPLVLAIVGSLTLMALMTAPAAAVAPSNDDFANALTIGEGFYSHDGTEMADATLEPGETLDCDQAAVVTGSVWFAWTVPVDGVMRLMVDGAWDATNAAVFGPYETVPTDVTQTGSSRWCVNDVGWDYSLYESVLAGEIYLIQLTTDASWWYGAAIGLELLPPWPPAPANDNYAEAEVVTALPFEAWPEVTYATLEEGEEVPCAGEVWGGSAWYRYTAPEDGNISVGLGASGGELTAAIYGPDRVQCVSSESGPVFGALRMPVVGGETYDIQVAARYWAGEVTDGYLVIQPGPPPLGFTVEVAPAGAVHRASGVAEISVTLTCTTEADFYLTVNVRQRLTRTAVANGEGSISGTCGTEPQTLLIGVADDDRPFSAGFAEASVMAEASNGWQWAWDRTDPVTVKLRPAR